MPTTKSLVKSILISVIILTLVLITNPSFSPKAYSTGTWTQTDWAGGSGQATWSNETRYDTAGGNGVIDSTVNQLTKKIVASTAVGQPNMTSRTYNNGGIGANTLYYPAGVYSDGTKLFVVDAKNNRVLIYNTIPTSNGASADVVVGQPDMASNTANNGGIGANTLSYPYGVYSDGTKLFVADTNNNRVLEYSLSGSHVSTLTSSAYDSGAPYTIWGPLSYTATVPANTSVSFEVSTTGGASWQTVSDYTQQTFGPSQTLIYKATLSNTDGISTPILQDVSVAYQVFENVTPGSGGSGSSYTPAPTPTPEVSPTPTPTPTPSVSLLVSVSPSTTPTSTPSLTPTTSPLPLPPSLLFNKNLYFRLKDKDVKLLQQSLNNLGFKISTGWGSPGYETDFFGPKTYRNVLKFQKTYNIPQTGFFGPLTREKMNELVK